MGSAAHVLVPFIRLMAITPDQMSIGMVDKKLFKGTNPLESTYIRMHLQQRGDMKKYKSYRGYNIDKLRCQGQEAGGLCYIIPLLYQCTCTDLFYYLHLLSTSTSMKNDLDIACRVNHKTAHGFEHVPWWNISTLVITITPNPNVIMMIQLVNNRCCFRSIFYLYCRYSSENVFRRIRVFVWLV